MELFTERLHLRQFTQQDIDSYAALCADPEVMRFLGEGRPLSREESWRQMAMILGHWQLRGYGLWAVEDRQTQQLLGRVGIFNPDGWPGAELGWMLGRQYWGQGYAYEAAYAANQWAQQTLNLSLISLIQPANQRSIALAKRLGMQLDKEIEIHGIAAQLYTLKNNQ